METCQKISKLTNLILKSRIKECNGEYGSNPWRIKVFLKCSSNLIKIGLEIEGKKLGILVILEREL